MGIFVGTDMPLPGAKTMAGLQAQDMGADWETFAASWDDLGIGLRYMADGGRYRRRRCPAAFRAGPEGCTRKSHQPHYQSRDYNVLNGDVERWFEPVLDREHHFTRDLIGICAWVFDQVAPVFVRSSPWHAEMHQLHKRATRKPEGRRPRACTGTVSTGFVSY